MTLLSLISAVADADALSWRPAPGRADTVEATLVEGGTKVALVLHPVALEKLPRAALETWLRRATHAVASYYGHFPSSEITIDVHLYDGDGVTGTTYGGRMIKMQLGNETTAVDLDVDWTMTHELFHTAFPDLDESHLWMQEGMATYFEPIARARLGQVPPESVWRDLIWGLPKGMPADGDRGLDRTPTWGRIYWGGALFWFLADMGIRQATDNKKSADDALRAILAAGGDGSVDWPVERVLSVGDKATGTTVLADLYAKMATTPWVGDWVTLLVQLGVSKEGRGVRLDDKAPMAAMRRSVTAPR